MSIVLAATRSLCLLSGLVVLIGCKPKSDIPPGTSNAASATPAPPSAEDVRVARAVMPISEVVAELRAGVPKETVLANVRERHIATTMVEANELELAANGAGHELLAALKDPNNLPTAAQEAAYMQLVAHQQPAATSAKRAQSTRR